MKKRISRNVYLFIQKDANRDIDGLFDAPTYKGIRLLRVYPTLDVAKQVAPNASTPPVQARLTFEIDE